MDESDGRHIHETKAMTPIPFNRPFMTGGELANIEHAYEKGMLSGNGMFSKACEASIEALTASPRALLTHSCTSALEMAAILLDLKPGDEIIMPAYTFVSTANAVVLRGAKPVFCDIRPDTLNIDETKIAELITPRTRSIWVVHYAGVSCEMTPILALAKSHNLTVVEDAAQGICATYDGRPLGSLGDFGTLSFHETKNISCGEGGALLVNDPQYINRAEIIQEKGTDRRSFLRGEVEKYTWQDAGSSCLLGELAAAFLKAQLDDAEVIATTRLASWDYYHNCFERLETTGFVRRPIIPPSRQHNAHMYYLILAPHYDRSKVLGRLLEKGIHAVFHYVPLDTSPAGRRFSSGSPALPVTADLAARVIRLPFWTGLKTTTQDTVIEAVYEVLTSG